MKGLIHAIETMYAATRTGDVDAWLSRTADALALFLGTEQGVLGFLYDASGITSPIVTTLDDVSASLLVNVCRAEGRVTTMSQGVVDMLSLRAGDADGRGAVFCVPRPRRRPLRPAERSCFDRLTSHLTAAYRLVACIGTSDLRAIARNMDRAAPADAEAPSLWSALAEGRYSLVDRFESDGKRFVVAHRAASGVTDPRALTKQERTVAASVVLAHSDKVIADQLGLGAGTVRAHVHAILSKLGLSSRAQLVSLFMAPCIGRTMRLGPAGLRVIVFAHEERLSAFDKLTAAERAVAELARRGVRTGAIAAEQRKTTGTVTKQLASAYLKLGVGSRAQLAALIEGDSSRACALA